jgi:hypothetical protein
MTKKDLRFGDKVYTKGKGIGFVATSSIELKDGTCVNLCYIYDDLSLHTMINEQCEIIKVERPVEYTTVYTKEDIVELTVDEISKKLGYKVKVVGEDR